MKRLKKLIFNFTNDYNLNEDQLKLIFGVFKDSAKTKQLNPAIWLYLNNYNSFNDILEDIMQQAILYSYEQAEMLKQLKPFEPIEVYQEELKKLQSYAYKATMRYIYNQHYKVQAKNRKLELIENKYKVGISGATKPVNIYAKYNVNVRLETPEQAEYWNSLVQRVDKNSKTKGGAFKDNTKKTKAINQLKRLNIID